MLLFLCVHFFGYKILFDFYEYGNEMVFMRRKEGGSNYTFVIEENPNLTVKNYLVRLT